MNMLRQLGPTERPRNNPPRCINIMISIMKSRRSCGQLDHLFNIYIWRVYISGLSHFQRVDAKVLYSAARTSMIYKMVNVQLNHGTAPMSQQRLIESTGNRTQEANHSVCLHCFSLMHCYKVTTDPLNSGWWTLATVQYGAFQHGH